DLVGLDRSGDVLAPRGDGELLGVRDLGDDDGGTRRGCPFELVAAHPGRSAAVLATTRGAGLPCPAAAPPSSTVLAGVLAALLPGLRPAVVSVPAVAARAAVVGGLRGGGRLSAHDPSFWQPSQAHWM